MNPHQQLIDDLYALAAFLEERPTLMMKSSIDLYTCVSVDEMKNVIRLSGTIEKKVEGGTFDVVKRIGEKVKMTWFTARENVCKRIKVGEKVIPAQEAKTIEIEAKPETVEAIYKWECPDSLLRSSDQEDLTPENDVLESVNDAIQEAVLPGTAPNVTQAGEKDGE